MQVQYSAYVTCCLRSCLRNILLVIKQLVAAHGEDVQVLTMWGTGNVIVRLAEWPVLVGPQ